MKKAKILIVDDVEIVCIHLEEELKENGYEASSALSGKKAIEKARKENFDIVFVDLIMPEMDGVETCWEIKKVNPKTEIILFSAHPTELELKKNAFIKAGGRDEFLRKPLMGGEVLQIMETLSSARMDKSNIQSRKAIAQTDFTDWIKIDSSWLSRSIKGKSIITPQGREAMAVTEGTVKGFVAKPFKPDDLRTVLDEVKTGKVLPSFGLTLVQQNALLKIGKLGAESASKALSQILKREIEITTQETTIFSIEDTLTPTRESKEMAAGLLLKCSGNISGRMLVLIPWDSALDLADLLEEKELGTTQSFKESTQMLLQSIANVLATSYLNATGKVLNLSSSASIERLFFDNRANVLKEAVKESTRIGHILAIVTEFIVRDTNIKGKILLLPDIDSLKVIFKQAGAFK